MSDGFTKDRFAAGRAAFDANLASGEDVGASFCATHNGEVVADLWGGYANGEKTRPWVKDTIVNVYSTTKTMTALTALLLADRGALDFDKPVAHYWPEFAANGKAAVKVSHLMSHSAGLSGWKETITKDDLYDWEKATSLLAAQAPFWEPGTAPGYHALTQAISSVKSSAASQAKRSAPCSARRSPNRSARISISVFRRRKISASPN